ncbi:uncharacterized protein E0L32_008757 [Thyridium curvatum]|uniref:Uncharacterized protein n=1 Tax=Thyridium curvatum TaxID=1093900 RepID=A0A507AL06_9PEZI|nr:uncharacterized protein E0L32_008757 [Thyridium curvatum]TPX10352.1 hypothetical protein E0L32_008757 [Thyridium curvatum]
MAASRLNGMGQVYDAYYQTAWAHVDNDEFDKANELAKLPRLVGFQPRLLRRTRPKGPRTLRIHAPDGRALQLKESLIKGARRTLEKAESDAKKHAQPLTEEEYDRAMDEYFQVFEAAEAAWEESGKESDERAVPEPGKDGSDTEDKSEAQDAQGGPAVTTTDTQTPRDATIVRSVGVGATKLDNTAPMTPFTPGME